MVASIILQQIQDNLIHPKGDGPSFRGQPGLTVSYPCLSENVLPEFWGYFLAVPVAGMIAAWMKAEALETEKLPESE